MLSLENLGIRSSNPEIEAAYQRERAREAVPLVRWTLLFGVALMLLGAVFDPLVAAQLAATLPELEFRQARQVAGLALPMMLATLAGALVVSRLKSVAAHIRKFGALVLVTLATQLTLPAALWGPDMMAEAAAWPLLTFFVAIFFLLGLGVVRSTLWALPLLALFFTLLVIGAPPGELVPIQVNVTLFVVATSIYAAWRMEKAQRSSFESNLLLASEKEHSERLLLNILPVAIARRLKQPTQLIADGHDDVTVLFSDLVGFTGLASKMPPQELVALLHEVVCRFDEVSERNGLEKIKTIGDAYMAAAGLPEPLHDHAAAAVRTALAMVDVVADIRQRTGHAVHIRIGLHSGSVVAGVIGTHKFAYDLWGDTVNMASRMESNGHSGEVQISSATMACLERGLFDVEPRGEIELQGLGSVDAFVVRGVAGTLH